MTALERLLKVAGTDRKLYREVQICGEDFSFWMTPLTIAERQSAKKQSRSEDANDYAIQLLVKKAMDENGQPMFRADAVAALRNRLEESKVQKLLLALIGEDEEEAPELDFKSLKSAAKEGKTAAR